eukprot:TRINITY_DN6190_c0_g1_i1.p1 TRINITY_DN6190_c0_g1~~TRINITY_DN6190_c0_g1_i1.p1  ORF type:complete len:126 (+),score=27.60 TRINITY_DN6190_c0_g1_i1:58-435(+)
MNRNQHIVQVYRRVLKSIRKLPNNPLKTTSQQNFYHLADLIRKADALPTNLRPSEAELFSSLETWTRLFDHFAKHELPKDLIHISPVMQKHGTQILSKPQLEANLLNQKGSNNNLDKDLKGQRLE